jgi:hypothetical protein
MDDAQAIRRLKGGDLGGLAILMERYQVRAARAAFLITHDETVAQDVVANYEENLHGKSLKVSFVNLRHVWQESLTNTAFSK